MEDTTAAERTYYDENYRNDDNELVEKEEKIEMKESTKQVSISEEEYSKLDKPIYENGLYNNPWEGYAQKGFWDIMKWVTTRKIAKFPNEKELNEKLPVLNPNFSVINTFHEKNENNDIQATWIGHSSFLIQMEGVNLLTDPVWSERCSPLSFAGPKRYRPPPITLSQLPRIDFILISHNHYDHLDSSTVEWFAANSPQTKWYVPLGLRKWFEDFGIPNESIVDLTWWKSHDFSENISVYSTPCQHWSKRTLNDTFKTLWTSWCVIGKRKLYFSGDTGYCTAFKDVGRIFGNFDLSLLPIGAYCPRWFMKNNHVDPEEAVKMHIDLNSKFSIGMHWGTFVLTDENIFEPRDLLSTKLENYNISKEQFVTTKHGETILIRDGVQIYSSDE